MEIYLFKLKFNGPTHFGETGIDLENVSERVSSDTLFSGLVNAYSTVSSRKEVTDFLQHFKEKPPFLISSLFIYIDDIYFLPKPLWDNHIDKDFKRRFGKELKRLKWLDLYGFSKWLQGELTEADIESMIETQKKYYEAFKIDIRPRVTLDRTTQQSALYHAGYVYFSKDAGLYGLVAFKESGFINDFERLLRILGEVGLGGERTYGCGTYKVKTYEQVSGTFEKILFGKFSNYIILSLYHPSEREMKELINNVLSYDLIRKRGWITSGRNALPYKRKYAGFFVEGSVFKEKPLGCLVDVTPDDNNLQKEIGHPVFRYGYAFSIPVEGAL
jgi:CRISPR-associated protein Csm4